MCGSSHAEMISYTEGANRGHAKGTYAAWHTVSRMLGSHVCADLPIRTTALGPADIYICIIYIIIYPTGHGPSGIDLTNELRGGANSPQITGKDRDCLPS